jgi:hypothetical protein
MSTAVNNIGGIVSLSGMTTTQIMDLLRNYILTYFGDNISVYDQASSDKTVFKCQVSSRSIPFYFAISVASGYVYVSSICRYWNATTHAGSGNISYTQGVQLNYSKLYIFVSKNIFFIRSIGGTYQTTGTTCAGIMLSMPAHYPDVAALTTAAVSNGYTVEIPVDNVVNFKIGMKVAVADSSGNGWGYRTITAIGSNSLTLSVLNIDLAAGSSVCVPPSILFIASGSILRAIDERTLIAADATDLLSTTIHPLLNESVFTKDTIQGDVFISPMCWYASFGSAYNDIDSAFCSGQSGTADDFIVKNTDGSVPLSGTAKDGNTVDLLDTAQSWTPSGLVGKFLGITGGTDAGNCRKIIANTETTITVDTPFPAALTASSTYVIADVIYRYVLFGSSIVAMRESW